METSPSQEEWRHLYQAAIAFKEATPWDWMLEDEVFGIRNPASGEIAWASVMGQAGEHQALALYLGRKGLNGFWTMHEGGPWIDPTLLFEIPQLQASFEDRKTLHKTDRKVIKSLGLKFRGRMEWPMFRSYAPGYAPWYVTAEEARFLAVALEQALDVAQRLADDPDLLEPEEGDEYLVRVLTGEGWMDEWVAPEPFEAQPMTRLDDARLAAARKELPRQGMTLEVDLFMMNAIVQESRDTRPRFPYALLVVEASSGMVVGHDLVAAEPDLDAAWLQAQQGLLEILERLGGIPAYIAVRDPWHAALVGQIAQHLDIELIVADSLPALDPAREFFEQAMG